MLFVFLLWFFRHLIIMLTYWGFTIKVTGPGSTCIISFLHQHILRWVLLLSFYRRGNRGTERVIDSFRCTHSNTGWIMPKSILLTIPYRATTASLPIINTMMTLKVPFQNIGSKEIRCSLSITVLWGFQELFWHNNFAGRKRKNPLMASKENNYHGSVKHVLCTKLRRYCFKL